MAQVLDDVKVEARYEFRQLFGDDAYPDILLIDGTPLKDLKLIIKDGKIYKNTL